MMLPARPVDQKADQQGEYRYLLMLVQIGYPVREAKQYLGRHLGNILQIRLVELQRGEESGIVRDIEVFSKEGLLKCVVRLQNLLPDGTEANFFAPPDLVTSQAILETEDGKAPAPLQMDDRIVLQVPVRSYMRFLPGIYRGSTPIARRDVSRYDERTKRQLALKDEVTEQQTSYERVDSFRQFLLMFQHQMNTVVDEIDRLDELTNPLEVDPKFLPWLSSWVNFHLDAGLPLHQQRELVRRAIRLQRMRGTVEGVSEMVRILTAAPVTIIERQLPKAMVLGQMRLSGGGSVDKRFLNKEPTPNYMRLSNSKKISFFVIELESQKDFKQRFGEQAGAILRRIAQVVTREMPAHVQFTIRFAQEPLPLDASQKDLRKTKSTRKSSSDSARATGRKSKSADAGEKPTKKRRRAKKASKK
ncbi:MAG: hypothetical protein CMK59_06115 [Proteobacteria bacterium]|nr:hypothetical protein [Pseudomonadota bacterium]